MSTRSAVPPDARRVGWGRRFSRWDIKVSPYLYVSPFFLLFAVFGAFPLLFNVVVAVHDWHRRAGMGDFVGIDNFTWVLRQPLFWRSLENTFSIFLWGAVPQLVLALLIAAVLDQNLRVRTFWRMSVLVPFVVMPVATAMIFGQVFGQFGLLVPNLQELGLLTGSDSPFFSDRLLSHMAIGSMVVFRWTGYNALIFLAAMQAVPRELYEASTVDGAGRLRQFFSVTLPSIRPTMIFVTLTMTIGGLQIFDEVRLYDGGGTGGGKGGADNQWTTVVLYLYELGFGDWQDRLGQAAAVGWIFAVIIAVFSLVNFLLTRSISSSRSRGARVTRAQHRAAVARARAVAAASTRPEAAAAAAPGRDGPPPDAPVHDADVQEGASR